MQNRAGYKGLQHDLRKIMSRFLDSTAAGITVPAVFADVSAWEAIGMGVVTGAIAAGLRAVRAIARAVDPDHEEGGD